MSQPYLSLEAELHDAFWDAEDDASEVRLMSAFLKKHPGPALEVGSGSGRLMFPLLKAGHDIEGLELSPDMIALGKIRAERLGVKPVVHLGDMTCWHAGRRYAALLAPAFTLQLAEEPEEVLRHWHSLLENHGGLYLTVFMPYAELLGDLPENTWYPDHQATLPDGSEGRLETRHRLDHGKQLLHREHRYSLSGTRVEQSSRLFRSSGFQPEQTSTAGRMPAVRDGQDAHPPQTHESKQTIRWIEHGEMLSLLRRTGFRLEKFLLDFASDEVACDPDETDFDGILTYHAVRVDGKTDFP
jgi:SAM-dependent methyltransferase